MTARQRQAPGSAAVAVRDETSPPHEMKNGDSTAFRWEEWLGNASPEQRTAALALAREQGLLYLQQIPAAAGTADRDTLSASSLAPLLRRLLVGKADPLPALADEALAPADPDLDPLQREAVRRALNTPDVCLLQGLPGTGKSRVVAEVVVQAAHHRSWRVLLLAPTAAAVDVVLERLADNRDVLPIRLLAPEERANTFPAWLRALTLPEQQRAFRERAVAGARQARRQAEEIHARREREESLWSQMVPFVGQQAILDAQHEELAKRRANMADAVAREALEVPPANDERPADHFTTARIELYQRHSAAVSIAQAARKALQDQENAYRAELEKLTAQLAALEPKYAARNAGRWWSIAYWTGSSALRERELLQGQRARTEAEIARVTQDLQANEAQAQQVEELQIAERRELVGRETERRHQELAEAESALRAQQEQLTAAWQSLCGTMDPADLRPVHATAAEVDAARLRWQAQRQHDEEAGRFARQWAEYLDGAGDQLSPRLPALANFLAGPVAAVNRGRAWADAMASPFDLLIIEEAESLTESELLRLAALAPRLLLVGQGAHEPTAAAPGTEKAARSLHGLAPLTACWPRLWQALADDLSRLPYRWERAGSQLVCHLVAVRPEDGRFLEREGLADAPEIELHILSLPRCKPVLARVSFPATYSIPQATAFIYRELQELPVQPLGRTGWWQESSEAWILHLGPSGAAATEVVDLGSGAVMTLASHSDHYAGRALRLAFAKSSGWDRAAACRWLEPHLGWCERDRAVFLQVPHRMERGLADVVSPLLFPDAGLTGLLRIQSGAMAPFEFIAVPTPRNSDWPREGAGLEQDLAAGRLGDRVPADLRSELPRTGIVNYLEAQALVRRLEQWARSPADFGPNSSAATPSVLVLALYEAQAELLRRLVSRSAVLQARQFSLEITVPTQARQRECDVVMLSLTRSHAHRCVPFGEDATDLVVALTRSRQRLFVFGDPGTLVKRSQWQGRLDHLDAPQAHGEAQFLGRILQRVQMEPCA